ncbi:MAG: aspartate-semialdehyde dehydrogenase, partial [Desulfovibrio sp.]|nr:aspartate-semialdehyde dehydrogenase [Desulfovibrio sp.]
MTPIFSARLPDKTGLPARGIEQMQEAVFIKRGKVRLNFYAPNGRPPQTRQGQVEPLRTERTASPKTLEDFVESGNFLAFLPVTLHTLFRLPGKPRFRAQAAELAGNSRREVLMSGKLTIAVAGATGAVGREMLKILEERRFPASTVKALASSRSAGTKLPFEGTELTVAELRENSFDGVDLALFSAGGGTSEKFAPHAVRSGCVVVDNSSAWRMDDRCPLVVPEVNAHALAGHQGIIADPNCSTIQMVLVLHPLRKIAPIRRVVVSTYQAVSGTGQKAVDELDRQVRRMFNMEEPEVAVYPHRIAFN